MELLKVILAGILGTLLMTAFSYLIPRLRAKQFREPQLLNMILRRSTSDSMNPSNNSLIGWVVHFSIGIILMTLFYMFHLIFTFKISFFSIFIYGIFAGSLSILSWYLMFSLSNNPAEITMKEFYFQLLIAHILFATGAVIFMI
ncbi:hypothetical protein [Christiangramia sabulilitoris]|uniref:DUF2938 domain-containing protein n=1 Tax=Christiangramia sabulilitoris TaxID=2583991 RepID=A0A550I0P2_9FLAO|nr:hypothetical protein [Christiangramia sabulilitoris]TRO64388.1 hypothetical protein FGM01_12925 [Christiangramia sabulilitoris]